MKIVLHSHEPQARAFGDVEMPQVAKLVRRPRIRLNPVVSDFRLFHAL
jgi:hypothetical protein